MMSPWIFSYIVNTLCSIWSERHVIVSNDAIIFAKTNSSDESTVLDAIPMFHIDEIMFRDANGDSKSDKETRDFKSENYDGPRSTANTNEEADPTDPPAVNGAIQPSNRRLMSRKWYDQDPCFPIISKTFNHFVSGLPSPSPPRRLCPLQRRRRPSPARPRFETRSKSRPRRVGCGCAHRSHTFCCRAGVRERACAGVTLTCLPACFLPAFSISCFLGRVGRLRLQVDGYNSGRIYSLRARSEPECLRLARLLSESSRRARRLHETQSRLLQLQGRCAPPPPAPHRSRSPLACL